MKKEDVEKAQEGELKDIKKFHYISGNISRLGHPGDDEEVLAEAAVARTLKLATSREFWKVATAEEICPRCFENSNGTIRNSMKGFLNCKTCGSPHE